MHELSIAESVVDMVVDRTGGRRIERVRLRIGRLSGVVAEALEFCFELAMAGTPLEGAVLEIEQPVGEAHCRTCAEDFVLSDLILLCPCGSADVDVLAGRELLVTSVEMG